jgi:hypothetical protein
LCPAIQSEVDQSSSAWIIPFVVRSVVDADAGGGGVCLLHAGACISPADASVELEITAMAPTGKHRSLFIVVILFRVKAVR